MAVPSGQTYQYSPLPSDTSIRLIQILSGPEEPIQCSLKVVDLQSKPLYDCLSYTWGDPLYHELQAPQDIRRTTDERKNPITCGGAVICVTENLREALFQLSWNGCSSDGRYQYQRQGLIWIDAVCIDQGNLRERNHQVAMMNRIYKCAQTVIVWLGISDQHTNLALETINLIASIPSEKCEAELPSDLEDPEMYEALGIPYVGPQQWLDYAAFLQRTWFSRIWVIQETSVAQHIVVLCGTHVLLWSNITAGSQLLRATQLGELLVSKVVEATNPFKTTSTYVGEFVTNQYIFENIRQKATSLNLEKLLVYSRYFNATNDRDRVYALLGMWEQSLVHKKVHEQIHPDYDLPVEKVYTQASWATIREMADLNILSLVEDASYRKLHNLPSWVPDYSAHPQSYPLVDNLRAPSGQERWKASDGLDFTVPVQEDLGNLLVEGLCIDTIADFAATETEVTDKHQIKSLLELLLHSLNRPSPYGSPSDAIEAFYRTLIKDTFRSKPAGTDARRAFPLLIAMLVWELENALNTVRDAIEFSDPVPKNPFDPLRLKLVELSDIYARTRAVISSLSSHSTNTGGVIPTWDAVQRVIEVGRARLERGDDGLPEEKDGGGDDDLDTQYDAIASAFQTAYMGRRLFRTSRNFLGIGPQSLEKGDGVWVLAGAGVPVILRRLTDGKDAEMSGNCESNGCGVAKRDGGEEKGNKRGAESKERWTHVGETYVHGIMNGEATTERKAEVKGIYLL